MSVVGCGVVDDGREGKLVSKHWSAAELRKYKFPGLPSLGMVGLGVLFGQLCGAPLLELLGLMIQLCVVQAVVLLLVALVELVQLQLVRWQAMLVELAPVAPLRCLALAVVHMCRALLACLVVAAVNIYVRL